MPTESLLSSSFSVTPSGKITFDTITGNIQQRRLLITNLSSDTLQMNFRLQGGKFSSSGGFDFGPLSGSFQILPGKKDSSVFVDFFPTLPGDDSAIVTLQSSIGDSIRIKLYGHADGLPYFGMSLSLSIKHLRVRDSSHYNGTNTIDTTFFNDSLDVSGSGNKTDTLIVFNFDEYKGEDGPPPYDADNKKAHLQIHFDAGSQIIKNAGFTFDHNHFHQASTFSGSTSSTDYRYNFTLTNAPLISSTDSTFELVLSGNQLSNMGFSSSTDDIPQPDEDNFGVEQLLPPFDGAEIRIYIKK
ncbi:MAG: hypothetical protein ACHQM6_01125 [Candidatus Kapaibacterium sp.]